MGKLRNDDGIEDHVNCATDGLLFVTGLRSGLVNNNNLIYKAPVCRGTSVVLAESMQSCGLTGSKWLAVRESKNSQ